MLLICLIPNTFILLFCSHFPLPPLCVSPSQLCLTLCKPVDCSPPACSVHGILQARVLEQVASPFSCPMPPFKMGLNGKGTSIGLYLTVCSVMSDSCDPMDCGPPGFSVHGLLQARILEWVAISYSRGSS